MTLGSAAFVGDFTLSPIAQALKALYRVASSIDVFLDEHIAHLKASANQTIACAGRVLEGAKIGFGTGYVTPIAILAVGQMLLGNPLAAVGQVVTGVTLTNPVAMTCAAIGAICYGWSALTEEERAGLLDRLAAGLAMGVELIRSLVEFVIRATSEMLSSKQLADFKEYVRTQAALFGKSLFDVTGKLGDFVKGAAQMTSTLTGQLVDVTAAAAKDAYEAARVKVVVASVMQPRAVFLQRDAPWQPRSRARG